MYINDIHILYYFFIGLLGLAIGQFMDWANKRLETHKPVLCKEFFKEYLFNIKINCALMYITAIIYIALLYSFGWDIKLIEYMILTPMFLAVFAIDYKKQIIPNRLTVSILEVGMVFAFLEGFESINSFADKILGMLAGAGIFLIITCIGGLIAGKEAMGFGDVKLMGALGLIFGLTETIMISVIAFLIAAIIGIILIVSKKKKADEYIPFGPFIIAATFLVMFTPHNLMLFILMKIFTLGMYNVA